MSSVWDKLDLGLSMIYADFLRARDPQPAGGGRIHPAVGAAGLHLQLRYAGDLGAIERAGFTTVWNDGKGRATGTVRLDDLERIAACDEVIRLAYGEEQLPSLDISVPDIKANQLWSLSGAAFSGSTGKGVIIGIIDTGIDIRHDFFCQLGTSDTTRILRIWDQGLVRGDGERYPDISLLDPGTWAVYGVEYTDTDINNDLQNVSGAVKVRHRDCAGHGTHVASIAAGNGQDRFTFIGVAPEADLVVVKLIHPEREPAINQIPVPPLQRFKDAVTYIRNVADALEPPRPVVINYSAGSNLGPHDGFSDTEDYLTLTFDPATSAGKLFVNSAGNTGSNRQHARVVFPAGGGTVEIPCDLYEERTKKKDRNTCVWEDHTGTLIIQCYYAAGGPTLMPEFQALGEPVFLPGPSLGGGRVVQPFNGAQYEMIHATHRSPVPSDGETLRNTFYVMVAPHPKRGHLEGGPYTVRLTASGEMTVHLWCQQAFMYGFKLAATQPAEVVPEDKFLICDPGGSANIVTVGSFNAEDAALPLARSSSRGPLVVYGTVPAPAVKPDLCAPGVSVHAARSRDARPFWPSTVVPYFGTSMAAPHVAGTLALMLEKKPDLTPAEALAALKAGIRATPSADVDDFGAGRLDAKGALDNTL